MPVPDFQSLMLPILKALEITIDEPMSVSRICERIILTKKLNAEEMKTTLLDSGRPKFANRIGWAITHMERAGLLKRASRGHYLITEEGKNLLAKNPTRIDMKVLHGYSTYVNWRTGKNTFSESSGSDTVITLSEDMKITPEEALDQASKQLRVALEADVLERVRDAAPSFLEQVVVDMLIAMGYGGGDAAKGKVTGRPGDGGFDGKIREDALGLDEVYLQAKRYAVNHSVGVDELRSFAGALDEVGAIKGVFVTTSNFTNQAKEYVEKSPKRIILIDGKDLGHLMVMHNIGVRSKIQYEIKRIDEDYFDSDNL